ncbi:dinucleotide-utilizing enzyme [uncultured Microbacterium sp.]|uniref:dinucleotide-utilizing enzyme n=1 Tax=uncultured Microbacterium sp. TaxID=191216 RepID=UPI00260D2B45|nr:dinucleotide-utilizing enzyme [uncultured Microbacterium sp.]
MTITRPRLTRSVPFWILLGGSVVSIGAGAFVLVEKLGTMAATLADGTATGVEVYAGQIWAVLGAILVGAGLIGLALAATLATLRSFAAVAPVEVVDAPAWAETHEPTVPTDEPATAEPVTDEADAPITR